jgi:hypothetical protein
MLEEGISGNKSIYLLDLSKNRLGDGCGGIIRKIMSVNAERRD